MAKITEVTSRGCTIASRPWSRAAPCSITPTPCADSPSSHTHWTNSATNVAGWRSEISERFSVARCQSVAAKAKKAAASNASAAASPPTSVDALLGQQRALVEGVEERDPRNDDHDQKDGGDDERGESAGGGG